MPVDDGVTLWLAGHYRRDGEAAPEWEFLGVFDAESKAVAACVAPGCFVAPVRLNEALGTAQVVMPGAYYPHDRSARR